MIERLRIVTIFIALSLIIFSTSCTQIEEQDNEGIIKEANLTEKEEALIKGTGVNYSFVFEYINNKDSEKIDVWIEKYLGGQKVGEILKTTNSYGDEYDKFITLSITDIQETNIWSISFIEGQNISTGKIKSNNELGKTSTWDYIKSINVSEGEYVLAALVGNDGNEINGIPSNFFQDPGKYLDDILINDYVYLLKIKIY